MEQEIERRVGGFTRWFFPGMNITMIVLILVLVSLLLVSIKTGMFIIPVGLTIAAIVLLGAKAREPESVKRFTERYGINLMILGKRFYMWYSIVGSITFFALAVGLVALTPGFYDVLSGLDVSKYQLAITPKELSAVKEYFIYIPLIPLAFTWLVLADSTILVSKLSKLVGKREELDDHEKDALKRLFGWHYSITIRIMFLLIITVISYVLLIVVSNGVIGPDGLIYVIDIKWPDSGYLLYLAQLTGFAIMLLIAVLTVYLLELSSKPKKRKAELRHDKSL